MRHRGWIGVAAAGIALVGVLTQVQAQRRDKPVAQIMKNKLIHAQDVLGAIAVSDFDKVRLNSAALLSLTQQAEWKAMEDPAYLVYSGQFRDALKKMETSAVAKNLDGSTVGYMQMTMACVNCHKFIRDRMQAAAPTLDATLLASVEGKKP